MSLREPPPQGFRPACELAIPAGARSASLNGKRLHLPRPNPSKILALGDTGCRIKGALVQDCNHPDKWPFLQLAWRAAREKADLVIHVGDYLYRESPCPAGANAMCGGTPAGDNWDAWNADFFTPAAKLLAASPWAFSRGNHEDCVRSWRGFFYYLDPRPWTGTCTKYSQPYVITLGDFRLAMIDSSAVQEASMNQEQISEFASQLSSLHLHHAWIADHHPFWGMATGGDAGNPIPISIPLQAAWALAKPSGFDLVLSGHIHLFEFLHFGRDYPPQLVIGDSGTDLAAPLERANERGAVGAHPIPLAESEQRFGYVLLQTEKGSSWTLRLRSAQGKTVLACRVSATAADACTPSSDR